MNFQTRRIELEKEIDNAKRKIHENAKKNYSSYIHSDMIGIITKAEDKLSQLKEDEEEVEKNYIPKEKVRKILDGLEVTPNAELVLLNRFRFKLKKFDKTIVELISKIKEELKQELGMKE